MAHNIELTTKIQYFQAKWSFWVIFFLFSFCEEFFFEKQRLFTASKSSAESLFIFAVSPAKNPLKIAFTGPRGELRGSCCRSYRWQGVDKYYRCYKCYMVFAYNTYNSYSTYNTYPILPRHSLSTSAPHLFSLLSGPAEFSPRHRTCEQ